MAKKKTTSNFTDLIGEQSEINSVEKQKEERMDSLEEYVDDIAETVNDNAKITNRLASKIDRISKTLSARRIKKLFENATPLNKFVEGLKNEKKISDAEELNKTTKLNELESQDGGMVDILTKILTFMQKNYDEDKLALEEAKNFSEEQAMEKDKKQKELLDALKKKKSMKGEGKEDATKEEDGDASEGIKRLFKLKDILKDFAGVSGLVTGIFVIGAALSYLSTGILASPAAENFRKALKDDPMLGALSGDTGVAASILDARGGESLEDWQARQDKMTKALKDAPFYTRVYGVGIDSYLKKKGFSDQEIKDMKRSKEEQKQEEDTKKEKENENLAKSADKKGLANASLEELEAKYQQQVEYGHAKEPATLAIKAEIDKRKKAASQTPTPATPAPAPSSAAPSAEPTKEATSNLGNQLNQSTNENIDNKLNQEMPPEPVAVTGSVNNVGKEVRVPNMSIPHVRNQEKTFQRIILSNTRIV